MSKLVTQFSNPDAFVYAGDCISLMRSFAADAAVRYSLIFGDPPFNIGVPYEGCSDDMSDSEYEEFTFEWMEAATKLLTPAGRLVVHVPDECVEAVFMARRRIGIRFQESHVWAFRFGPNAKRRFTKGHCWELVFTFSKTDDLQNYDELLVPCDRATKYKDKRTESSKEPGLRLPFSVWGASLDTLDGEAVEGDGLYWSRVQGGSKERRELHENQLPERLLERNILAYTNSGDWVLDPFAGSGTTATVARAMGRRAVTIDQSLTYAQSAAERIEQGAVRIPKND